MVPGAGVCSGGGETRRPDMRTGRDDLTVEQYDALIAGVSWHGNIDRAWICRQHHMWRETYSLRLRVQVWEFSALGLTGSLGWVLTDAGDWLTLDSTIPKLYILLWSST
jgi:hypothetical protein